MARAVEDFFYECLNELYTGWQDNEGSWGQLVWDVKCDAVTVVRRVPTGAYDTEVSTL